MLVERISSPEGTQGNNTKTTQTYMEVKSGNTLKFRTPVQKLRMANFLLCLLVLFFFAEPLCRESFFLLSELRETHGCLCRNSVFQLHNLLDEKKKKIKRQQHSGHVKIHDCVAPCFRFCLLLCSLTLLFSFRSLVPGTTWQAVFFLCVCACVWWRSIKKRDSMS